VEWQRPDVALYEKELVLGVSVTTVAALEASRRRVAEIMLAN
jgi:hypothetical protein